MWLYHVISFSHISSSILRDFANVLSLVFHNNLYYVGLSLYVVVNLLQ